MLVLCSPLESGVVDCVCIRSGLAATPGPATWDG